MTATLPPLSRYWPGELPNSRLKALDREALVLYPVRRAMASTLSLVVVRYPAAWPSRILASYRIGLSRILPSYEPGLAARGCQLGNLLLGGLTRS